MGAHLSALAEQFGGRVVGDDDPYISSVASLTGAVAGHGDLVYLQSDNHRHLLAQTQAAAVVLAEQHSDLTDLPKWVVADNAQPRYCFIRAAALLHPIPGISGIAASAVIDKSAQAADSVAVGAGAVIGANAVLADNCRIYPGVVIGDGVRLGAGTVVYPNAVCYPNTVIGSGGIIHAGAVIGADGFGYADSTAGNKEKFPHLGGVRIGDDAEIGANSCIDRGALDNTEIGDRVKIDNQVQIGHNVRIGADTVICGKVGIAGSTVIGARCVIGGGVGISGHLTIGDSVMIAGNSSVTRNIPANTVLSSVWPAQPIAQWRKFVAHLRHQTPKK